MKSNLSKMIPLLGLVAIFATSQAFAYDDADKKSTAQHAVPPAVHPPGDENLTFFIGAAYTFWQPFQGSTVLANGNGDLTAAGTVAGKTYTPQFNGQSGFKVSLGANVDHDGWNVMAQYTWFYNNPSMSTNNLATDGGTITSLFDNDSTSTGLILGLQSKFKNQFNRIDAVLDRAFYAGHYLAFRPFIGIIGAWDSQNLDFDTQTAAVDIAFDAGTFSYRNSQNWWGIGPYAGVDSSYYFTNEWAIFLSSGMAMLLANHDVLEQQYDYTDPTTINSYIYNSKANFNAMEPMLEASLGVRWDSYWTDWALRVEIAWELQNYFAHSGFDIFPNGVLEDYAMQGLTAGLRVNF